MTFLKNISFFAIALMLCMMTFDSDVQAQKVNKKTSTKKSKKDKKKKGKEPAEPVEDPAWKTKVNDFGCLVYGEDSVKTLQSFSLYREDFKNDNFEGALPNWEFLYNNSPGFREQTFKDGEQMYKAWFEKETDETKKKEYFEKLMSLYDQRAICWGKSALTIGKKGLRYAEYYPDEKDKVFDYLSKSVENGGNDTDYPVIARYFKMIVDKFQAKEIPMEDLEESYAKIKEISDYNIENNEKKSAKYAKIMENLSGAYDKLTTKATVATRPDVNNCAQAKEYYGGKYKENPTDKTAIQNYYAAMIKFRCTDDSEFLAIAQKYNEMEPTASKTKFIAKSYMKNGDYANAETYFNKAIEMETSPSKKAGLKMNLANMYNYKMKQRSKARSAAKEAASLRPDWGDPWILIGNSYAAQASACGGFDGRAAIWVAMDNWSKAKRVDPSSADKAQSMINKYSGSTPDKKTLFQRGLSKGQSYTVSCIGVSTTVR